MRKNTPYILTAVISLFLGGLAGWFINEASQEKVGELVFENTAYWTADCAGRDTVEFTKAELSNPETAAKYLTDTYRYYEWAQ